MARRRRGRILVAMAVAGALGAVGAVFLWHREQPFDRSFDSRVSAPAYAGNGPLVLYDEGHRNTHTATRGYRPFADLVRSDGYELRVGRTPISKAGLAGVSVLIVVCARGANDANDAPAFSDAEIDVIEAWVRGGGSLLLVTDHWPYGTAVESLPRRFGVESGQGLIEDPEHHDPDRGESHLEFTRENGLLGEHPITHGRYAAERVSRVLTFTGQSLAAPEGATALLALSPAAVERPPTAPRVEKDGGNVRVNMEYGDPAPAGGRAQGIAMEVDRGRMVILGDAGMLRAQIDSRGTRVGMNASGFDNRQLAINIMHWLSRVL